MALAALAGNTVVAAAMTDAWGRPGEGLRGCWDAAIQVGPMVAEGGWRRHATSSLRPEGEDGEQARAALEAQWVARMRGPAGGGPGRGG